METIFLNFDPLPRKPLRFVGVFWMAWKFFCRSFKSLYVYLLIFQLPLLLTTVFLHIKLREWEALILNSASALDILSSFFRFYGIFLLVMLVYACLLSPITNAVSYMEMDQCVDGKRGTLGQLFRYATPIGLKQFYSTYWAARLISLCYGFVLGILMTIFMFGTLFTIMPGIIEGANFDVQSILLRDFSPFFVIAVLSGTVIGAYTSLIYPVAVHEGQRAFRALRRAFQLYKKRFWRLVCVYLVYFTAIIILLFCLSFLLTKLRETTVLLLCILEVVYFLIVVCFSAFTVALATAQYVDASSYHARWAAAAPAGTTLPPPTQSP
jgi:hypothetical protein